jgi:hypothetical protein
MAPFAFQLPTCPEFNDPSYHTKWYDRMERALVQSFRGTLRAAMKSLQAEHSLQLCSLSWSRWQAG